MGTHNASDGSEGSEGKESTEQGLNFHLVEPYSNLVDCNLDNKSKVVKKHCNLLLLWFYINQSQFARTA